MKLEAMVASIIWESVKMFMAKARETEESTGLFSTANTRDASRAQRWLADRVQKSKRGVFVEEIELTPTLAELLVSDEINVANRGVRWAKVARFAEAIKRGEWELNGETIKISRDGLLNDGQNRALAVIQAARPIKVLAVFGVDRETRHTIDTGSARTLADILDFHSEANSRALAAAIRMLWLYENGKLPGIESPTHTQAQEVLDQHPLLRDSVTHSKKVYKALRGSIGTWAFTHYVCASIDRALIDKIYGQLATGLNYDKGKRDPSYKLREHLLGLRGEGKPLNTWQQASLTFKMWNMKRGFEHPGVPRYDASEPFPIAR